MLESTRDVAMVFLSSGTVGIVGMRVPAEGRGRGNSDACDRVLLQINASDRKTHEFSPFSPSVPKRELLEAKMAQRDIQSVSKIGQCLPVRDADKP